MAGLDVGFPEDGPWDFLSYDVGVDPLQVPHPLGEEEGLQAPEGFCELLFQQRLVLSCPVVGDVGLILIAFGNDPSAGGGHQYDGTAGSQIEDRLQCFENLKRASFVKKSIHWILHLDSKSRL